MSNALAESDLVRFTPEELEHDGDGIPRDLADRPLPWVDEVRNMPDDPAPAWGHDTFIVAQDGSANLVLRKPSDAAPEPTEFILNPLFPREALSILAGDSGSGKSTLCAWIEAKASRGELSDGRPLRCMVLANEDSIPELSALYKACGADTNNIRLIVKESQDHVNRRGEPELMTFGPKDLPMIVKAAHAWRPDIIRIDPLHRFADGDWNAGRTANFLDDLNLLAQNIGCAIIGVMHTRKGATVAKEAITGTGQWVAKARSAMVLAALDGDTTTAVLQHTKSNVAKLQNFEITFNEVPVKYTDGVDRPKRVVTVMEPTTRTVDDIYSQNAADRAAFVDHDELGDLESWVYHTIDAKGGHMFATDLFDMAKNNAHKWAPQQVRRAFKAAHATTTRTSNYPARSVVFLKDHCTEEEAKKWGITGPTKEKE